MHKLFSFAVATALLASAGCLQMNQELLLNADGSTQCKLHYAMSEQAIAQMEAMKKMAPQDPNAAAEDNGLEFDEKKIRADFEKSPAAAAGAELKEVRTETKDGWRHAYVTVLCKDLASAGAASGQEEKDSITLVKNAEGNYVLTVKNGDLDQMGGKDDAEVPDAQKQQRQAMMKAMMAGFKVSVKVTVPGEVVESNAHATEGRTVSWVLDVADDQFFAKSAALKKTGMQVTFKGAGLDLKEVKPAAGGAEGPAAPKDAEPN